MRTDSFSIHYFLIFIGLFSYFVLFDPANPLLKYLMDPMQIAPNTNYNAKEYKVSGTVTQVFPYCSGARPSKEMEEKQKIPQLYPNKNFYIKCGNKNHLKNKVIKQFTTDSLGGFEFFIKPGMYAILLEEQLEPVRVESYATNSFKIDEACLQSWWAKPYYLLEVKDHEVTSLHFEFQHRCFIKSDIPCVTYIGPLPH